MEPTADRRMDDSLAGPQVVEKYQAAGKVAQQVLGELAAKCVPGADLYELTRWGNKRIDELCAPQFASKKIEKGVAFPVCISPNEMCGNFAPLKEESQKLADGDLAKIELGVHFDGFPVSLAHTVVVGKAAEGDDKLLAGGFRAVEAGVKSLAVGAKSSLVAKVLEEVAKLYGLTHIDGSAVREVKRYLLEGGRAFGSKFSPEARDDKIEFKANEVFAVEALVALSACEGKAKTSELRTTVYRRNIEQSGDLKTSMGRQFLREVREKFSDLSFSLNSWDDELVARAGINDCLSHNLVTPLPTLLEKSKARVAHFKWTVGIMGKRLILLAAQTEPLGALAEPIKSADEEVQKALDASLAQITAKPPKVEKKKAE